MTKFGRILFLMRKWRQKCSLLQFKGTVTEKTWGRGWVVLVVKTKMADTSLASRVRTTAGTRRSNSYKHSKNSKKTTRRATSATGIWRIFAVPWPLASVDNTLLDLLNSSYPTQARSLIANQLTICKISQFQQLRGCFLAETYIIVKCR